MSVEIIYTASATAAGGRDGHVKTSDGVLDLELRTPGAGVPSGVKATNPEQLFAAGYAACFAGALNLAAKLKKIHTGEIEVKIDVTLKKDEIEGFFISADIFVRIPGVEDSIARELVVDAHNICPYSKATRNNIETKLNVVTSV